MLPRHACQACVDAVAVTGAGLMLAGSVKPFEPVHVTDRRASEMAAMQATLGEGPGIDALESGTPILLADLASAGHARRWPAFATEALRLGVRAVFSLPLALGAIRVGVLDLYHDTPRELGQDQLVDALVYADTALLLLLNALSGIATSTIGDYLDAAGPVLWRAEVHQAAGMVSVQLGVSVLDALVRLRVHAHSRDQRLTDVARSVVERRLRFHPEEVEPVTDHDRDDR